jgi:hypothetical protein
MAQKDVKHGLRARDVSLKPFEMSPSIVNRAERGDKLSCPGLLAMLVKSIRIAGMLLYCYLLQFLCYLFKGYKSYF